MKKNHRFLIIAALALAGAMAAGCSELEIRRSEQANDGKVTLTTTLCFDDSDATKALTSAGVKAFAAGDRIAVIYKNTSDETVKAVSAALSAGDIYAEGKKATISVTLTDPAAGGALRYIYPAAMAKAAIAAGDAIDDAHTIDYARLQGQDGKLTTLARSYDLAVFDGSLTGTATLPESATLTNRLTIGAFTIQEGSTDITGQLLRLTVSHGSDRYEVNRLPAAGPIYVAMRPVSGDQTVTVSATDGLDYYAKTVSGKTLAASSLYPVTVSTAKTGDRATPLTFEAITAGAQVTFHLATIVSGVQYSTDGSTWTDYVGDTAITLAAVGDRVMFRGDNGKYFDSYSDYCYVTFSEDCYIYGNIMSLISSTGFVTATTLTEGSAFKRMFREQSHLKNHASKPLVLPVTTVSDECYYDMFYHCLGLTTAPVLPATTMATGCYHNMFQSCSSLTTPSALPATTLATDCYRYMFDNCPSLTIAPDLPATTLANGCYAYMFKSCTNLTTAPDLPATTLVNGCYNQMFWGCINLSSVTCAATEIMATDCTAFWLSNVAATGTFTTPSTTAWTLDSESGIPAGWTRENL